MSGAIQAAKIGIWKPASAVTYTIWNGADKSALLTLSGSNLVATHTGASGAGGNVRSVKSNSTGKWYYELTWTTKTSDFDDISFGVATSGQSVDTTFVGSHAASWGCMNAHPGSTINKRNNSSNTSLTSTGSFVQGDVFLCAVDIGAGNLWFGRNGSWFNAGSGVGDPGNGLFPTFTGVTGTLFIMGGDIRLNDVMTLNPGPTFTYTLPTGFSGWTS